MSRAASQTQIVTKPAVITDRGLVTAQNRIAAAIGADVLGRGGNAVDAAIATSFALGVVEPWMSGVGGGGYMIIRRPGDDGAQVIDFGMRAPSALRTEDYPVIGGKTGDLFPWPRVKDDANVMGARAVAIPGLVAGMGAAHGLYGSLAWADLLAPAVAEARNGLLVDWYAQLIIAGSARALADFPTSREIFLDDAGFPKASAWTALGQTRCDLGLLADTLATLAREGPQAFYSGPLAEGIVADLQEAGGRHTLKDFATYRARTLPASDLSYRGHRILGTPEMTAGPTLERVFRMMEDRAPAGGTPTAAHYAALDRAIRQANGERYETMGDPEDRGAETCTTHFNVVDAEGTIVSVTQTLLSIFGSRLALPRSGVIMNNGIMWFDPEPGRPNSLGPGKRCLANMCPTLLERADGARFGLGAAGGRKIMPAVAQLVSYLLDFDMTPDRAMHMPRIDCSLAETTIADASFPPELRAALETALPGVTFAPRAAYPFNFACPSLVARMEGMNHGTTEIMAHWADTVAAST